MVWLQLWSLHCTRRCTHCAHVCDTDLCVQFSVVFCSPFSCVAWLYAMSLCFDFIFPIDSRDYMLAASTVHLGCVRARLNTICTHILIFSVSLRLSIVFLCTVISFFVSHHLSVSAVCEFFFSIRFGSLWSGSFSPFDAAAANIYFTLNVCKSRTQRKKGSSDISKYTNAW